MGWTIHFRFVLFPLTLTPCFCGLSYMCPAAERSTTAFYAGGLVPGSHNVSMYYYVIANGFLKIYIVVLYMSQSFYGLNGGTHRSVPSCPSLA